MNIEHYQHFCNVISKGPATGLQDTAEMVMTLSDGKANPDTIALWWAEWQMLKQAMKDNHPMIKLAGNLAPPDFYQGVMTKLQHGDFLKMNDPVGTRTLSKEEVMKLYPKNEPVSNKYAVSDTYGNNNLIKQPDVQRAHNQGD